MTANQAQNAYTNMATNVIDDAALEHLDSWEGPAIALMDLDAFFASVEQLDHPEWRGKPVIVGGSPDKRGVVSTCSYEARKFGVRSAMPSSTAARLCPEAIWTPGSFHRYRELSKIIMGFLYDETPHVMQVSIDEAFIDISPTRSNREHPVHIARRIQRRVDELGVTCSIGLGSSKSVAKIASDINKPHGITVVQPGNELAFLGPLPVSAMSGIGPVATRKLNQAGITTLGELGQADDYILKQVFGKNHELMRNRALGVDTQVQDESPAAKSISNETSVAESVSSREEVYALIATMAHKVGRRLRRNEVEGNVLHLKIRLEDLSFRTTQKKIPGLGTNELVWLPHLHTMLDEIWHEGELVRLVGVGITGFEHEPVQDSLFPDEEEAEEQSNLIQGALKNEELLKANDAIAKKFGEDAVRFGHELKTYGSTTGSSAKNPDDYKN